MISSGGVGSGLDVESIVGQLMVLEQRPLLKLRQQQAGLEAEISAIGSLKSAVSALRSAATALGDTSLYRRFDAVSSDAEVFTASASSAAAPGIHSISITDLAKRHRLASDAFADATTTVIGSGTLNIDVGGSAFSLTIDATNNTLAGIRDAINGAASNSVVTASIVTADDGARLILTSNESGEDGAITVTVSGDGDGNDTDNTAGISRLVYDDGPPPRRNLTELDPAQNARLTVDTFTVTSSSNSISGVIEGVTLELESESSATLTIGRNDESVVSAAEEFVNQYNLFRDTVATLRNGVLNGDALLRVAETSLRRGLTANSGVDGLETAFDVGFSVNDSGVLSLNTTEILAALDDKLEGVVSFFADDSNGFAARIDSLLEGYVESGGILDQRADGVNALSDRMELRAGNLEARLVRTEQRIRNEFTNLDTLISSLEVTNNFLLQQLQNLPFNNLGER